MTETNRHGLPRPIPAAIKREVRQRSKFGCVLCRSGFVVYEHIEPPFAEAKSHDPNAICCLCPSCHQRVTSGQLSKKAIWKAYEEIQRARPEEVIPPTGPLDFHEGTAELVIGGIRYHPAIRNVLRYHGQDMIKIEPGAAGEPGAIYAVFSDDAGNATLRLENGEWEGSLDAWDVEVVGQRITVRRARGRVVLQLRLDPPGRVIVERLDMRIGDAHILASEQTYVLARYFEEGVVWARASFQVLGADADGVAIEFTTVDELDRRHPGDFLFAAVGGVGFMFKPLGIALATRCSMVGGNVAIGEGRDLNHMRRMIFEHPDKVDRYVESGEDD